MIFDTHLKNTLGVNKLMFFRIVLCITLDEAQSPEVLQKH